MNARDPVAVVREEQRNVRLYTPQYGRIELRAKATDDPRSMVALWLIGYEDEPERSVEICVSEIFGRDVRLGGVLPQAVRRRLRPRLQARRRGQRRTVRALTCSATSSPGTGRGLPHRG